ncbi:hypothetical protein G3480_21220 [Thiorhodococcus mannitoliphagus]|uniref:Uncharacterized protein n=1 Tax=Thiorhodococcus mannitoliphagus TaxID=329406 RepID=A0A6P1E2S1_9GAMM|nr:hypothetical protein [Thiorhodococcus mannitoliphagus]NEX22792.1 hypothetical protein [Thiorhodococcus mannitoliphagus]
MFANAPTGQVIARNTDHGVRDHESGTPRLWERRPAATKHLAGLMAKAIATDRLTTLPPCRLCFGHH